MREKFNAFYKTEDCIHKVGIDVVEGLGELSDRFLSAEPDADTSALDRLVKAERDARKQVTPHSAHLLPQSTEEFSDMVIHLNDVLHYNGVLLTFFRQENKNVLFRSSRPILCAPGIDENGRYYFPLAGARIQKGADVRLFAQLSGNDPWLNLRCIYGIFNIAENRDNIEIDRHYIGTKDEAVLLERFAYILLHKRKVAA